MIHSAAQGFAGYENFPEHPRNYKHVSPPQGTGENLKSQTTFALLLLLLRMNPRYSPWISGQQEDHTPPGLQGKKEFFRLL